jgi:hypothetical protein
MINNPGSTSDLPKSDFAAPVMLSVALLAIGTFSGATIFCRQFGMFGSVPPTWTIVGTGAFK